MPDIVKIQKTVRKSIKDYGVAGNHEEEALVSLISVDLYLALEERESPTPTKPKRNAIVQEVAGSGEATECNRGSQGPA